MMTTLKEQQTKAIVQPELPKQNIMKSTVNENKIIKQPTDKPTGQPLLQPLTGKLANKLPSGLHVVSSDLSIELDITRSETELDKCNLDPLEVAVEKHVIRLVPREFRAKKVKRKKKTYNVIIMFDQAQFYSCTSYKQLFIILSSIIIMLTTYYGLECGSIKIDKINTDINIFNRKEYCPGADIFFIIATVGIIINLILITAYSFHFVEYYSSFPWLATEFLFCFTSSICYIFMGIVMFTYGRLFTLAGLMGLMASLNLFALAVVKYTNYVRGRVAQLPMGDPDQELRRALDMPFRFMQKKSSKSDSSKKSSKKNKT